MAWVSRPLFEGRKRWVKGNVQRASPRMCPLDGG
jgi:hypothetical protein